MTEKVDFEQLQNIFMEGFGKEISSENLMYKYNQNPYKTYSPIALKNGMGELVGMVGMMYEKLKIKNEILDVVYLCDVVVLDHGNGRKGGYLQLLKSVLRLLQNEIDIIIFQSPTDVHDKILSNMHLEGGRILKTLSCSSNAFLNKPLVNSYAVEIKERLPFSPEEIELIESGYDMGIIKDELFFKWKIDSNKFKKCYYCTCHEKDFLKGYVIFEIDNKDRVNIFDWFLIEEEKSALCDMLCAISSKFSHIREIRVKSVNVLNLDSCVWKSVGFHEEKSASIYTYSFNRGFSVKFDEWEIRDIDDDMILYGNF